MFNSYTGNEQKHAFSIHSQNKLHVILWLVSQKHSVQKKLGMGYEKKEKGAQGSKRKKEKNIFYTKKMLSKSSWAE